MTSSKVFCEVRLFEKLAYLKQIIRNPIKETRKELILLSKK
jgi:hypothetical protein